MSTPPRTPLPTRVLGSAPVVRLAHLVSAGRVRVLAYHDVPDAATFERHLDFISRHYRPVPGEQVIDALGAGRRLPRRAIWITFDDSHPGAFAIAMPLLARRGISATVFTCPGVVDTDRPYWWQVLDLALANGHPIVHDGAKWTDHSAVSHLKRVPDAVRRSTIARVAERLGDAGIPLSTQQATSRDLRSWLDSGLEVGNHTWDHPCLDMCDEAEQRRQIEAAHDWLREFTGRPPRLFAYPNGNVAATSRAILAELGYGVTALFDHRLARLHGPEVSRLRLDADASPERLAAVASGAHPSAFALVQRVRRSRTAPWDAS